MDTVFSQSTWRLPEASSRVTTYRKLVIRCSRYLPGKCCSAAQYTKVSRAPKFRATLMQGCDDVFNAALQYMNLESTAHALVSPSSRVRNINSCGRWGLMFPMALTYVMSKRNKKIVAFKQETQTMADPTGGIADNVEGDLNAYFDPASGILDRRVFSDEKLFQLELDRIFARGWNFLCHESQLKEAGDYLVTYVGTDQLIVVRDESGEINALLNSCRHRGNTLCRAEQGRAKSFICSYHGWNYALDGRLIGVPGQKTYYRDQLNRERLGLARARVENYLGMYFATLDPGAPPLYDFLGEVGRSGIASIFAHGEVEVVEGIQKNIVDCNWKIAVDNLFDWYHVPYSHASASTAGIMDVSTFLYPKDHLVILGEYGHAIGGPSIPKDKWREVVNLSDEERAQLSLSLPDMRRYPPHSAEQTMGEVGMRSTGHPNIFPNLWITLNGTQMCLRIPRGPSQTELWWYTFVPKDCSPEWRQQVIDRANHVFGPAGLLEQDDGDNWSHSTRASRGTATRKLGQHLTMGLGQDEIREAKTGEHYVDSWISEHAQRWFYQAWVDWVSAPDWQSLKRNHSPLPKGVI